MDGRKFGEMEDQELSPEEREKESAAATLGRKGGMARAKKLTPERRLAIARNAAKKRWLKD